MCELNVIRLIRIAVGYIGLSSIAFAQRLNWQLNNYKNIYLFG